MTKSRFSFLTVSALLCSLTTGSTTTARAADDAEEAPAYQPFSIGAEVATPGVGGSASWRFSDHVGVRAGFNYWSYSDSGDQFMGAQIDIVDSSSQQNVIGHATINKTYDLMSAPIGLDIYPWKKSSFRITAGIMVNQNEATGVVPAGEAGTFYRIGNSPNSYDAAGIGGLTMKVEPQPISPYLSIGYSYYFDKAKHWSLSGELGVAYTGSPDVSITTGTPNALAPQDLNALTQQIEDGTWKFLPILRIGVNYSF